MIHQSALKHVRQFDCTLISECTLSFLWRWQRAGAAYWQSHDCLWTNGCVTESKTLGKGEAMDVIQNKNVVAFYCQAMRLYLRASSLTISVLLTFNILTFIRGNGKWTSAVHRRDEAEGGWMQWDLLPSSSDKVNIDTPTAQHNTKEYTLETCQSDYKHWICVFWMNCKDHGGHIRRRLNALETHAWVTLWHFCDKSLQCEIARCAGVEKHCACISRRWRVIMMWIVEHFEEEKCVIPNLVWSHGSF